MCTYFKLIIKSGKANPRTRGPLALGKLIIFHFHIHVTLINYFVSLKLLRVRKATTLNVSIYNKRLQKATIVYKMVQNTSNNCFILFACGAEETRTGPVDQRAHIIVGNIVVWPLTTSNPPASLFSCLYFVIAHNPWVIFPHLLDPISPITGLLKGVY